MLLCVLRVPRGARECAASDTLADWLARRRRLASSAARSAMHWSCEGDPGPGGLTMQLIAIWPTELGLRWNGLGSEEGGVSGAKGSDASLRDRGPRGA